MPNNMENKKYVFLEVGGEDCQFLRYTDNDIVDGIRQCLIDQKYRPDCHNCPHGKTLEEMAERIIRRMCANCEGFEDERLCNFACPISKGIIKEGLKALLGGGGK